MKPITPTTTALIGALALFATGCHTPGEYVSTVGNALTESGNYPVASSPISMRDAKIAQMRASNYYSQLSTKQQRFLKSKNVRYLAVDAPSHRNRGYGTLPVLVYDLQTCQLVSLRPIKLPTPPSFGQVLVINGYRAQYIRLGSM